MFSYTPPESLFVAVSMLPKATVQAALGPGLLAFGTQFPLMTDDLRQVSEFSRTFKGQTLEK